MRRTVKKVIDGDTFEVKVKIQDTNFVRIAKFSAPELNQFGGQSAKRKLKRLIEGKIVTLVPKGRSYGRIVADVRLNGKKVSNLMKQ
jgi:endonuclease YncB( thermonuclease family)